MANILDKIKGFVNPDSINDNYDDDYDFIDERHRLPGLGVNDWSGILSILETGGYCGPLMYEIAFKSRDNDPRYTVTLESLKDNMERLAAGEL